MSVMPIRMFGDPVLREPARPVESFDEALRLLAEHMIQTMHEAPGVGLAAPQVGRSLRLIVFDLQDEAGPRVLANPVLRDEWGEQVEEEGCLSIPGLYYPVSRAMRVWAMVILSFPVPGSGFRVRVPVPVPVPVPVRFDSCSPGVIRSK